MKTKISFSLLLLFALGFSVFAQEAKTEKFGVSGLCSMCEARIEKAASSVEGVGSADWDQKTKVITVSFDTKMTDIHKIQMAIAGAGHDTDMHKATDEAYEKLPACCKYREEAQSQGEQEIPG